MAERLPNSVYKAINAEMTPAFNRYARKRYGMSGKRLLAKVAAVEGGGSIDENTVATSYAGAKGPFQFIASTRAAYISQYGVDPWKSDRQAAKGAMIHLKGTGVAGYNPGMSTYEGLVLNAKVDTRPLRTGKVRGGAEVAGKGGGRHGGYPSVSVPTIKSSTKTVTDTKAFEQQQRRYQLGQRLGGESKLGSGVLGSLLKSETFSGKERSAGSELLESLPKGRGISSLFPSEAPNVQDYTRQETTQSEGQFKLKGRKGRKTKPGGAGGGRQVAAGKDGWQGSKTVIENARRVADRFGIPISSEKRSTVNTASGGVSDHYDGNKAAYALDIDVPGIDTAQGKKIAKRIARQYGMDYQPGQWNEKTIKVKGRTYRIQLGYGGGLDGHDDHIHIGVARR